MVQIQGITTNELETLIENVLNRVIKPTEPAPENPEYITRLETAKILRITLPTLNDYTKRGIIIGYRIGSRVRYKRNEVEAAVKRMQTIKYRG